MWIDKIIQSTSHVIYTFSWSHDKVYLGQTLLYLNKKLPVLDDITYDNLIVTKYVDNKPMSKFTPVTIQ